MLLVLSTVALLYGKKRLALLVNYLFTMYWGYGFNREYLRGFGFDKVDFVSLIYLGFGLIIVGLVLIGFFAHSE